MGAAKELIGSHAKRHSREMERGQKRRTKTQGVADKEKEMGGRIGLKISDNEMSPVIVPAVINGVPLYDGSPCPWESKR